MRFKARLFALRRNAIFTIAKECEVAVINPAQKGFCFLNFGARKGCFIRLQISDRFRDLDPHYLPVLYSATNVRQNVFQLFRDRP